MCGGGLVCVSVIKRGGGTRKTGFPLPGYVNLPTRSNTMTTMCNISCVKAITLLVFILTTAATHCAAEDSDAIISDQNLFRQDRSGRVPEKSASGKMAKKPDTSHLELYGTIILGDKKTALIYTHTQKTDKGQQQDKSKRAGIYSLGDSIGSYVISAIEKKKVVLDYHGEKAILTLRKGTDSTRGDYTSPEEEKSEPSAPAKRKPRVKEGTPEKQDREKPGSVPKTAVKSPIMSSEEAEGIVAFSEEILEDIQEGGTDKDQKAIEEKKEELRKRLLEKLEQREQTDQQVR